MRVQASMEVTFVLDESEYFTAEKGVESVQVRQVQVVIYPELPPEVANHPDEDNSEWVQVDLGGYVLKADGTVDGRKMKGTAYPSAEQRAEWTARARTFFAQEAPQS